MNKQQEPTVEILQPESATLSQQANLEKLITRKVAELMGSSEDLRFEPWFRTKRLAYEIKRLQSVPQQKRWRIYFEQHGCLKCDERKRTHAGLGLCTRCRGLLTQRLKVIDQELMPRKAGAE